LKDLLVMKFGGTSVGSAERMKIAGGLVAAEAAKRPVLVVVSALSKITDLLLDTAKHGEADDQSGIDRSLEELETRHFEVVKQLLPATERLRVHEEIDEIVGEFRRIVKGIQMLGYRPPRSVDEAIAIARALMHASRLMLLDEPTAALGVHQTQTTLEVIRSVARKGLGVIVISHNLADVFEVADRIVVLRLGRNAGVFDAHKDSSEDVVAAITGASDSAALERERARIGRTHGEQKEVQQ